MPYFNQSQVFLTDKAILAFTEGNIANVSVTVPNTHISLNSENRRTVDAGYFVAEVGNIVRFLPYAKTISATSTTSPQLRITPYNIFIPGDIISILNAYTILTVSASGVNFTHTITINGRSITTTVSSSNTSTAATEIANGINNAPFINTYINAIASGNTVVISANDGTSNYAIARAGTVTSVLSTATLAVNSTPIGTIQSIDPVTGIITLTGNASVTIPPGVSVGVPVKKILGLHIHSVDYTLATAKSLALYTQAAGVRIQYLPFYDCFLKSLFPKMLFDTKF